MTGRHERRNRNGVETVASRRDGGRKASLTIKNVPEPLLERLREEAERSHRSINRQVIETLERELMPRKLDVAALVERARELRARGPRGLTTRELDELRRAGRS